MSDTGFDREWRLAELLDPAQLERLGPPLRQLLGGDAAILDADGHTLWGLLAGDARRQALILELEPLGYLASNSGSEPALAAATRLLTQLLRSQARFRMASSLHLEAVAEDFETLKREHARLVESENRYKKLAGELESRVQAQVAQLEERQQMLYQAEKLASVGQLAAGMAHEINNPLGFARSNLSTFGAYLQKLATLKTRLADAPAAWHELDMDFVLEDGLDLLGETAVGLERIARIVADLKSFSNVDRATEELADLNDSIRQAAGIVERQLPPDISLHLELGELPRLVCLPGHLNQLFHNLIRNAVQAIQDAGRPGVVRVTSQAGPEGISVRIADDGVGMTPEQRERAFEPFFTTRPVGKGAGLGLSTARNIVLAHSGRIAIDSEPGRGTTLNLSFPTAP
ncbi:sensor histidine kinase [Dechloromonas agitata]|uniref:sensor histidine kinase n=1 Tax=Dechloromonas agitata TaxID=73030 RepID=UPI000487B4AF|nr:ATP-binding protein [Dechloromonas agitata]